MVLGNQQSPRCFAKKFGFCGYSFADKLKKIIAGISGFSYQFLTNPLNRNDRETIKDQSPDNSERIDAESGERISQ